jgi:ABC-type antimicrobial peptide transport system permease subunit
MAIGSSDELGIEIVGLVRDATYDEVRDVMPPTFFMPYRQSGRVGALTFYVRTSGDPRQVLRAVPGVVARLDPSLPVEELKTMAQQVRENLSLDRLLSTLSTAFAVLATLLAAIGLYGVVAYTVAQRTREIGVRMALGASVRDIRGLVLRQVGGMVLAGGTVGVLLALGLGRAARSVLYEVEGQDPLVVGLSVALLALVGLGAGYFPARRASRVDPMQALRYE